MEGSGSITPGGHCKMSEEDESSNLDSEAWSDIEPY